MALSSLCPDHIFQDNTQGQYNELEASMKLLMPVPVTPLLARLCTKRVLLSFFKEKAMQKTIETQVPAPLRKSHALSKCRYAKQA